MISEPWLLLNNKKYSLAQLNGGTIPQGQTTFEKSTLRFYRDWLQGKDKFTVSTSGSTGVPKPITFDRRQLEASARLTQQALGLTSGHTALLCLDPDFIAGKMMIVRALTIGMNIIAVEPSANPLATVPAELQIDFAAFVPYQLQSISGAVDGIARLNTLKAILVGGAATGRELRAALRAVSVPVFATYGMTETLTHIALQPLNGASSSDHFTTLPGVTIRLDDRGCLIINAPHLGESEIVTNDLVELLASTQFRWLGRWDTIVNTGGVKVVPEKIEAGVEIVFEEMGLDNRILVSGWPDEILGNKVVIIVEGQAMALHIQQEILQRLHARLTRYEVPKEIKFIEQFAETETQKVNRIATLKQLKGHE